MQRRQTSLPRAWFIVDSSRREPDELLRRLPRGTGILVLRGAEDLLRTVRYLKTEVADFEAYEGCCTLADLEQFLVPLGFVEFARTVTALHPNADSERPCAGRTENDG